MKASPDGEADRVTLHMHCKQLCENYRLGPDRRLPIWEVGVHPQYRQGVGLNVDRCVQLANDILRDGFDEQELLASGVCIAAAF